MNKKELRAKYKQLRQQFSLDEIEDKSLAIANRLLSLDIWEKTYFHLFLTIEEQKEVETEFILQILAGKDKEIVVAKSNHLLSRLSTRISNSVEVTGVFLHL